MIRDPRSHLKTELRQEFLHVSFVTNCPAQTQVTMYLHHIEPCLVLVTPVMTPIGRLGFIIGGNIWNSGQTRQGLNEVQLGFNDCSVTGAESDKSSILLIRLQRENGSFMWVLIILNVVLSNDRIYFQLGPHSDANQGQHWRLSSPRHYLHKSDSQVTVVLSPCTVLYCCPPSLYCTVLLSSLPVL